jgi:hypothetical protein
MAAVAVVVLHIRPTLHNIVTSALLASFILVKSIGLVTPCHACLNAALRCRNLQHHRMMPCTASPLYRSLGYNRGLTACLFA